MKPQGVIDAGIAGDFVSDSLISQLGENKTLTVNGHADAPSVGHKAGEKVDEPITLESIQTSLSQMASGKTISAKALHQRLRLEDGDLPI